MAVFNSQVLGPLVVPDHNHPAITEQLAATGRPLWQQPPPIRSTDTISTVAAFASVPVQVAARAFSSVEIPGYFRDFYLRLRLTPSLLDLGNVASAQSRTVHLWNANLVPITITSLEVLDGSGLAITAPAGMEILPFVLQPLQQVDYGLFVSLSGQPNFDARLEWITASGVAAMLRVLGSRVVPFPFEPDWAAGIDETLSARSSVLRSPNGDEQSISLWQKLRRSYSVPYTLKDDDARLANNLMFGWQSRLFAVPAWPEMTYLTAPAAAGADTLFFSTVGRSLVPGGLVAVFLRKQARNAEMRQILSVTSSSVRVTTPFANAWPAGARVAPVLLGAMTAQVQGSQHLPTVASFTLDFAMDPATTTDNAIAGTPAILYRGYEVYLDRTNWRDGLTVNSQSDVQVVDFHTGVVRLRPVADYAAMGRSHDWYLKSLEKVTAFRSWLKRRLGKTVGVWMTSARQDFRVIADVEVNAPSIRVRASGYSAMVDQNASRQDIYIRLTDGTYYFRRIIGSTDNGDDTETLSLDTVIPARFAPADVRQFSFLTFYRMAGDDATIHWLAPGVAEATTGLTSTKALQ